MSEEAGKTLAADFFDGLPEVIRIGPFDIAILVKGKINDDDDEGTYSHGVAIELRSNQPNATFALDTLLHEINHGIYRTFGLDDKSSEESIVATMATGWTMIYRDNPTLIAWMCRMALPLK